MINGHTQDPPPPPDGLAGEFVKLGEIVKKGYLVDYRFFYKKGGNYKANVLSEYACPRNYWVFKPFKKYFISRDGFYICPMNEDFILEDPNEIFDTVIDTPSSYEPKPKEIYLNLKKDDFDSKIELTNQE